MSKYADRGFWVDTFDRTIATGAQVAAGTLAADYTGLIGVDYVGLGSIVGFAMVGTVLTSIARQGGADRKARKAAESEVSADSVAVIEREAGEVPPPESFVQSEFVGEPASLDEQREDVRLENALDRAQHGGQVELEDPSAPDDMEHYGQFEDVTDDSRPDDDEHYREFEDVTGKDQPDERAR